VLEQPEVTDGVILDCLRSRWELAPAETTFLPVGYSETAAYRVVAGGDAYFLKLRRGGVAEVSLAVPRFLVGQGVDHVIPPIETRDGSAWVELAGYAATLYPFVAGRNGFEQELSDGQWVDLGRTLEAVHTARPTPALAGLLPREDYVPVWREKVLGLLARLPGMDPPDAVGARMAEVMTARAGQIRHLVEQADRLARALRDRPPEPVLCHSDVHAGNVLITGADRFYVVDWDEPLLAPKERDLMFIGAGIGGRWDQPREAELFYRGYGPADVDPVALAYYRCERIIVDVALFAEKLLLSGGGGADRARSLRDFTEGFDPGSVVDIAFATADRLPGWGPDPGPPRPGLAAGGIMPACRLRTAGGPCW
jgi:spectinomycin phosphotransferase